MAWFASCGETSATFGIFVFGIGPLAFNTFQTFPAASPISFSSSMIAPPPHAQVSLRVHMEP
jgi:hypothetical protein